MADVATARRSALRSGRYALDGAAIVGVRLSGRNMVMIMGSSEVPILTANSKDDGWHVTYHLGGRKQKGILVKQPDTQ